MSKVPSTPNSPEDRGDENASSGTICRVAELDGVRHGDVGGTELETEGVEEHDPAEIKKRRAVLGVEE